MRLIASLNQYRHSIDAMNMNTCACRCLNRNVQTEPASNPDPIVW